MTPPKALVPPKPRSSNRMTTTLGASLGALTSNTGGALASRASSVVIGGYQGPLMGSSVRSTCALS